MFGLSANITAGTAGNRLRRRQSSNALAKRAAQKGELEMGSILDDTSVH
jgi:hypothetical protein